MSWRLGSKSALGCIVDLSLDADTSSNWVNCSQRKKLQLRHSLEAANPRYSRMASKELRQSPVSSSSASLPLKVSLLPLDSPCHSLSSRLSQAGQMQMAESGSHFSVSRCGGCLTLFWNSTRMKSSLTPLGANWIIRSGIIERDCA